MTMNRIAFAGVTLVLSVYAAAHAAAQAPTASRQPADNPAAAAAAAGDAGRGKGVFLAHQCWACHGYTAETGTRLLLENGAFVARLANVKAFTDYLRAPRPDQAPPARSMTAMPSYGVASLPDSQAADLFAYIRSLKPTTPPLKEVPLLVQMAKEGGKVAK
jgi:mono/diheme cytochrome c family protein